MNRTVLSLITVALIWLQIILSHAFGLGFLGLRIAAILALHMVAMVQINAKASEGNIEKYALYAIGFAFGMWAVPYKWVSFREHSLLIGASCLIAIALFFAQGKYTKKIKGIRHSGALIALGIAVIAGIYIKGRAFDAQWYIIDDHEILNYLGDDGNLPISELPSALVNDTEVFKPGSGIRYRPSYYILRLMEISLWGGNTFMWHSARYIGFIALIALILYMFQSTLGFIEGAAVMLFLFTFGFWSDIWIRLGPAESYASLGIAMTALSIYQIVKYKARVRMWWAVAVMGMFVSAGAKENFLISIVPVAAMYGYLKYKKIKDRVVDIGFYACAAYTVIIAYSVIKPLMGAGADIYMQDVSAGGRADVFLGGISAILSKASILDIASALLLAGYAVKRFAGRRKLSYIKNAVMWFSVAAASMGFLYLSQYVFYNGQWPQGNRYDFPGMLSAPFLWIAIALAGLKLLKALGVDRYAVRGMRAGLSAGLILLILAVGFPMKIQQRQFVDVTKFFTKFLDQSYFTAAGAPDYPILVEAFCPPASYEPALSLPVFLRYFKVKNPILLKLHPCPQNFPQTPLSDKLTQQLSDVSVNGGRGYAPYAEPQAGCLSIGVSADPEGNCMAIGRVW